jgi:hypothetical protein
MRSRLLAKLRPRTACSAIIGSLGQYRPPPHQAQYLGACCGAEGLQRTIPLFSIVGVRQVQTMTGVHLFSDSSSSGSKRETGIPRVIRSGRTKTRNRPITTQSESASLQDIKNSLSRLSNIRGPDALSQLSNSIMMYDGLLTKADLVEMISWLGEIYRYTNKHRSLVFSLTERISKNDEVWDDQSIGKVLLASSNISCKDAEYQQFLEAVLVKLKACQTVFEGSSIANCLFAFKNTTDCFDGAVMSIIDALAERVSESHYQMSAVSLSKALFGMRNFSDKYLPVRKLCAALTKKIKQSESAFGENDIKFALALFRKMSTEHAEIKEIMRSLIPKIEGCTQPFSSKTIEDSLYYMHTMRSECEIVRSLISALTTHIALSRQQLSPQEIGHALLGLKGKDSRHMEVRNLLSALVPKVVESSVPLTPKVLHEALAGLRKMDASVEQVRHMLFALGKVDFVTLDDSTENQNPR